MTMSSIYLIPFFVLKFQAEKEAFEEAEKVRKAKEEEVIGLTL